MAFMTNQNALKPVTPALPHDHDQDHDHGHDHPHGHAHAHAEAACCGSPVCGSSPAVDTADIPKGALLFRIPTMDCAVEESEIRRALEPVAGRHGPSLSPR
jgi:Cd2+/Zn2+-exporting ATPase